MIIEVTAGGNDTRSELPCTNPLAIEGMTEEAFHAIENRPNPFSETTVIGFLMGNPLK